MSLDAFGKVITDDANRVARELVSLGKSTSTVVSLGNVDDEDHAIMREVECLDRPGVLFSVCSSRGDPCACGLWGEAFDSLRMVHEPACEPENLPEVVLRAFLDSRLGRVCAGILESGIAAAVALVDGPIECTFQGTLDECLRRMAADVLRPWDQSPNRLYVRSQ